MAEHGIDKFGEMEMSEGDYGKKKIYIAGFCKCSGCPSFVAGDKEPGGYCFPPAGNSEVIKWEKDCICGTCPVYKEYSLEHLHYCTRCSELCQMENTVSGGGGHE